MRLTSDSHSLHQPDDPQDESDNKQDVDQPTGVEGKQTQQPQNQEDDTDDHEQIYHIDLRFCSLVIFRNTPMVLSQVFQPLTPAHESACLTVEAAKVHLKRQTKST
jgi:hypothetical protein